MRRTLLLATALFLTLFGSGSSELVALGNAIRLSWTFTTTNITFTLVANTTGWAAIGFSPHGGMAGADIAMIVAHNGNVAVQDRYATEKSLPAMDAQQDYTLLSGSLANGQVRAVFSRLLDTCDPKDAIIKSFTTKIIVAYGALDGSGNPQYHGFRQRASTSLHLLSGEPAAPSDAGIFNIDPAPQNISISSDSDTLYWCSVVQLPRLATKAHIIELTPVITPGNEDIVHHILVYLCDAPVNSTANSFNCFDGSDPGNQNNCTSLIGAWAIGGKTVRFPPNVGLPLEYSKSVKYVLIQTHYNTMGYITGRIDASYLRFVATHSLRSVDAGILDIGIVDGMLIPPNVDQTFVSGYCPSDCLSSSVLPSSGINVVAVGLHSHLLGKRITLRHFRPSLNIELPVIVDDPLYDFDFQETVHLDSPRVILPGDVLQTVCVMNSSARNVATQGGAGTMQEMCLSFLLYYPKVSLQLCQTSPSWLLTPSHAIYQLLGKNSSSFDWGNGVNDGLVGANWSSKLIQTLHKGYTEDANYFFCAADFTRFGTFVPPTLARSSLPNYTAGSRQCQSVISTTVSRTTSNVMSSNVAHGLNFSTTNCTGVIGHSSASTLVVLSIAAAATAIAL